MLKKTLDGKDIVTIHCYGRTKQMKRNDAVKEFMEAINWSEGSERERYTNILMDLMCGKDECWDK